MRKALVVIFVLVAGGAFASVKPVRGIDVIVQKQPGGTATRATANSDGVVEFKDLEPGHYVLTINPCSQDDGSKESKIDPIIRALLEQPDATQLWIRIEGLTCALSEDLPLRARRLADGTVEASGAIGLAFVHGGVIVQADPVFQRAVKLRVWIDSNADGTIEK